MSHYVIARAFQGEPLKRAVVSRSNRLIYLANPEGLARIEAGESSPVGFPQEDVFAFESSVFIILVEQWARQRTTDSATWQQLTPYALRM